MDIVNKFTLVFSMAKKRISLDAFTDLCCAAAVLAFQTEQAQLVYGPGMGQLRNWSYETVIVFSEKFRKKLT